MSNGLVLLTLKLRKSVLVRASQSIRLKCRCGQGHALRVHLFQMPFPVESVKELVVGGAVGLCVGVVAKRVNLGLGVGVVGGVATTLFVLLRGAIFDGRIRASW